jgi:hypothetical protein
LDVASFKTASRPVLRGRPFLLEPTQEVTVNFLLIKYFSMLHRLFIVSQMLYLFSPNWKTGEWGLACTASMALSTVSGRVH